MSNFKVEFTLKQHTPIIHFQSEQSGATLRATELKPKLDKFITQRLKFINEELYQKYKSIIEDEDIFPKDAKGSSRYKISVEHRTLNTLSTPKAYVNPKSENDKTAYQAPYFADVSKSAMATSDIKVSIQSFNSELLKLLDSVKDYIFIYENFGTRQSKGFGSFLRSDIDVKTINSILKQHENAPFSLGKYSDYQDAFKKVDSFYKRLKMGINSPYEKSLLFRYMCSKYHIGWEKKFIKKNFPEVIHGDHKPIVCEEPDSREFRYIRALLGLAEHNEFRPGEKQQVKIKSTNGIERFKSPITFKIFNNIIYVLFNDSYKNLLDEEFKFSLNGESHTLKTPIEFDLYDFLKFVEKNENTLKEVE